jgi:hypothetical protein
VYAAAQAGLVLVVFALVLVVFALARSGRGIAGQGGG